METLVILFVLIFIPFGIWMQMKKKESFADLMQQRVATQGGSVLGWESRTFRKGPFWVMAKGQVIIKMVYRDREGALRQAWGRSGTLLRDDEVVWDYDDGDYNV